MRLKCVRIANTFCCLQKKNLSQVESCYNVVKCHGSSDAKAVYYTIKQVRKMLDTKVVEQLVDAFDPKEEVN